MKNSTSITKNTADTNKYKYFVAGIVGFILIWKIISLNYKPIILPSPELTFLNIYQKIKTISFWLNISYSFFRIITGYLLSMVVGVFLGTVMGLNEKIKSLFSPLISILQTTPNISWILLAIIWFGLNSKIVIFTIFISILPIFVINSSEGVRSTDINLIEIGEVYKLSTLDKVLKIYFPSAKPYIISASIITIERAWKIGAMAELLSLETGIGSGLYWARNNLETEGIFAWTIVLILLGYTSSKLLKKILT